MFIIIISDLFTGQPQYVEFLSDEYGNFKSKENGAYNYSPVSLLLIIIIIININIFN